MPYALTVQKIDGKPGQVYYPLVLKEYTQPTPGPGEVLVRMRTAALNHRDLFVRQNLYPGISFDHPLMSDGAAVVEAVGPDCRRTDVAQVGASVVLTPCRGWVSDPLGPEKPLCALGGALLVEAGTASDYLVVPEDEVELSPAHLSLAEAAAVPLAYLTAWRAVVTKGRVDELGKHNANVLVTGIGGGVAQAAAQLAAAHGCRVYVTSGGADKLQRARSEISAAGAGSSAIVGGASYRDADWDKQLLRQLPADKPRFDLVVDGAGGDIIKRACNLLREGGAVVQYGMTVGPRMDWIMKAVLKNIDLRGSTMGSRVEFRTLMAFVRKHQLRPVVSRVVYGGLAPANLPNIDTLFDDMKEGRQFGKLVLAFDQPLAAGRDAPKL